MITNFSDKQYHEHGQLQEIQLNQHRSHTINYYIFVLIVNKDCIPLKKDYCCFMCIQFLIVSNKKYV